MMARFLLHGDGAVERSDYGDPRPLRHTPTCPGCGKKFHTAQGFGMHFHWVQKWHGKHVAPAIRARGKSKGGTP